MNTIRNGYSTKLVVVIKWKLFKIWCLSASSIKVFEQTHIDNQIEMVETRSIYWISHYETIPVYRFDGWTKMFILFRYLSDIKRMTTNLPMYGIWLDRDHSFTYIQETIHLWIQIVFKFTMIEQVSVVYKVIFFCINFYFYLCAR